MLRVIFALRALVVSGAETQRNSGGVCGVHIQRLNPLGLGRISTKRSQGITQELHDTIQQIFDSSNSMPRVVLIGQSSVPPGSEPHDVDTEARSNAVLRLYSEAVKTTQLLDSTDNQIHMNTSEEAWTQSALSHTQSKGTRGGYMCISREQLECDARRMI